MATFKINGKNFATQDGTGEPTVSSNVIVASNQFQQTQIVSIAAAQTFSSSTLAAVTNFNKTVTVKVAGSKMLVQLFLSACIVSNQNSSNGWKINYSLS